MHFSLSADQQLLKDSVASFVKRQSPITRARELRRDPLGYSRDTWATLGELGWLGLAFSEAHGGLGGSFVDLSIVLEELGAALVPEPLISSIVLAGHVVAELGTEAQRAEHLAPVVAGARTLALAHTERDGRYDPLWVSTTAARRGDSYALDGEKIFVLGGHDADDLVVVARTSGAPGELEGLTAFLAPRGAPGVTVSPLGTIDGRRAAHVTLRGASLPASARLGDEGAAGPVLSQALDRAAAAACAEGVGLTRAVLEMTTAYLCTREQFGVKIGSFQALQHRAVDMFIETELVKSASIRAAIALDAGDPVEAAWAVSLAKAQLGVGGKYVVQQAIQLHGGVGITDEHDVGLYFKRMHALMSSFGDEAHHVARVASSPRFTAGL